MNGPSTVRRWAPVVVGVAAAVLVGVFVYNLGFAHGAAQHLPAPGAGPYPYPWPHRHFGFGLLFPLLFILLVFRLAGWGRPWGRGWGWHDAEEWHRRMHERDRPAPPTT